MSEPCSFFLRATIEKSQYLKFMQAKPSQPLINDKWLKWWDSREMYGKPDLTKEMRAWNDVSNQEVVDGWLALERTLTFSVFDEATNGWEFGIIMYSENYTEILPLLAFCESICSYKLLSPHDFAIVYPYCWDDTHVMAYMTFAQDGAVLTTAKSVTDVAKEHLDYAALRLEEKSQAFEAKK